MEDCDYEATLSYCDSQWDAIQSEWPGNKTENPNWNGIGHSGSLAPFGVVGINMWES